MAEIGAPWAAWHSLRHTYASIQLANGVNLLALSRSLGHHSASFTLDVYAHLLPGDEPPRSTWATVWATSPTQTSGASRRRLRLRAPRKSFTEPHRDAFTASEADALPTELRPRSRWLPSLKRELAGGPATYLTLTAT